MSVRRLEGKVVAVTGGARGIGRAEALLFAEQGAKVVVNDLGGAPTGGGGDVSMAQSVVEEIRAAGGEAVAETSSMDSMAGGQALIDMALRTFGRIDVLSNNAGIIRPGRIDELAEEDFDRAIAVNLKGYFATIRAAAPHFIKQRSGVIICKSSNSAFGHYGLSTYAAAKEGVVGLTRTLARELGEFGVRVNTIRPISLETTMYVPKIGELADHVRELGHAMFWNRFDMPKGAMPGPAHVAALTVWLATDAAKEVNGREWLIGGSEVGLFPEPELQRSLFEPGGWSLDALDRRETRAYLIGDVRNRFAAPVPHQAAGNP